jgi:YHS domain-containing protein
VGGLTIATGSLLLPYIGHAKKSSIYTPKSSNQALSGYDAVAYFTQSKATRGEPGIALDYQGAQWLFSSEDNRKKFLENPDAYIPQYGGYCAFSVSKGNIVKGDPELWVIHNNKLYVNFNKGIHKLWNARKERHIRKADNNWPGVLQ